MHQAEQEVSPHTEEARLWISWVKCNTYMQSAVCMSNCLARARWYLTCQDLFRERISPSAQLCVLYGSRLKAGGNLAACVPGHVIQHYMIGWQSTSLDLIYSETRATD